MEQCAVCGKPASVHLTQIGPAGQTTEAHLCPEHAKGTGVGPAVMRRTKQIRNAIEIFVAFVKVKQQMPTLEQLRALGLVGTLLVGDPSGPEFARHLDWLNRVAKLIIAEAQAGPGEQ